jgi:DNA-directed RNA polymerase subunit K/omega
MNQFAFVIVSGLRSAQLMRGCVPRVASAHKSITTAQREVAQGKVIGILRDAIAPQKLRIADMVRVELQ